MPKVGQPSFYDIILRNNEFKQKYMKKRYLTLMLISVILMVGCGAKKQPPAISAPMLKGISLAAVAAHNAPDDCWLVINNNIYNVSDYVGAHPGGEKNIINYCGKDATTAFETRTTGSGTPHSDRAREMLAKYYIGDLAR
jgi:hypothetical protein